MNLVFSFKKAPDRQVSRLEQLPDDIIRTILQNLETLRDLKGPIKTSKTLYRTFKGSERAILTHVLAHSLSQDVVPDANAMAVVIMAYRNRRCKIITRLLVAGFRHSRENWPMIPRDMTCHSMLLLHQSIEYFTHRIYKAGMRHARKKGWQSRYLDSLPLSPEETTRIQRALYRFQLYVTMFSTEVLEFRGPLSASTYWSEHVSIWEMEEIGCIHDMLYDLCTRHLEDAIYYYHSHFQPSNSAVHYLTSDMGVSIPIHFQESPRKNRQDHKGLLPELPNSTLRASKLAILSQGLPLLQKLLRTSRHDRFRYDTITRILEAPMWQSHGGGRTTYVKYFTSRTTTTISTWIFNPLPDGDMPGACQLRYDRIENPVMGGDAQSPGAGWIIQHRRAVMEIVKAWGNVSTELSSLWYYKERERRKRRWGYALWDHKRFEKWASESMET